MRTRTSTEARFLQIGLGLLAATWHWAALPQEPGQETRTGASRVFRLEYRDNAFGHSMGGSTPSTPFTKEPDFQNHNVLRQVFAFATATQPMLGYAWDASTNTLYIDLNGNLDLTDDPTGVFRDLDDTGRFDETISFEVCRGPVATPYRVRMRLYDFGGTAGGLFEHRAGTLGGSFEVQSGWAGLVELNGKTWQMGVLDAVDGVIGVSDVMFLRPPPEGDTGFDERKEPLSHFPAARRLFLEGRCYGLDYAFDRENGKSVLSVTFTEQHPEMGEIEIQGQSIQRLELRENHGNGDISVVVLDDPGARVSIPSGKYNEQEIFLRAGKSGELFHAEAARQVDVRPGGTTTVALGAPVRHDLSYELIGEALVAHLRIVGISDERFAPAGPRQPRGAPTLTITSDGKQVAQGDFRYG